MTKPEKTDQAPDPEKPSLHQRAMNELMEVFAKAGLCGLVQTRQVGTEEYRRGGWEPVLSPMFPAAWPPNGKGVIYGFAHAYDTEIKDAEPVGSVWAEVRVSAGEKTEVANVKAEIRDLGLQEFHPVSMREPVVALWGQAHQKVLKAKSEKDLDDVVRKVYRQWREFNPVICTQLEPLHRAFFEWLSRE